MATKTDWERRVEEVLPCACKREGLLAIPHGHHSDDCLFWEHVGVLRLLREFQEEAARIARYKGCTNAGCNGDDHGWGCPCGIANRIESMLPAKKED